MISYWFWDVLNDESLGLLSLDKKPEKGDIIVNGFIRNNPIARWEVLGHRDEYVLAVLESGKKYLQADV